MIGLPRSFNSIRLKTQVSSVVLIDKSPPMCLPNVSEDFRGSIKNWIKWSEFHIITSARENWSSLPGVRQLQLSLTEAVCCCFVCDSFVFKDRAKLSIPAPPSNTQTYLPPLLSPINLWSKNHFKKTTLWGRDRKQLVFSFLFVLFLLRLYLFLKAVFCCCWFLYFCIVVSELLIIYSHGIPASHHCDITPHSTHTSLHSSSFMFTSFRLVSPLWSRKVWKSHVWKLSCN